MFFETHKDLIQSIGIMFSILLGIAAFCFSIWQIRLSDKQFQHNKEQGDLLTKQILASISSTIASRVDALNQLEFQNPEFSEKSGEEYTPASEHSQTSLLTHMRLNLFEQVYFHHTQELINDSAFEVWKRYMNYVFQQPFTHGHWKANRDYYGEGFREMIDEIVNTNLGVGGKTASK